MNRYSLNVMSIWHIVPLLFCDSNSFIVPNIMECYNVYMKLTFPIPSLHMYMIVNVVNLLCFNFNMIKINVYLSLKLTLNVVIL